MSRLALKPGRYEVRVALDSGPGQRASVYTYVDVPDFAQQPLSLSGIVVAAAPAVISAPANAFANLLPVVPTAQREFPRASRATAFVRVYQRAKSSPAPAEMTARIADVNDRVVLNTPSTLAADRFAAGGGADYRVELQIERLDPGEYLLTIEATQGQSTARRGLRFTVR